MGFVSFSPSSCPFCCCWKDAHRCTCGRPRITLCPNAKNTIISTYFCIASGHEQTSLLLIPSISIIFWLWADRHHLWSTADGSIFFRGKYVGSSHDLTPSSQVLLLLLYILGVTIKSSDNNIDTSCLCSPVYHLLGGQLTELLHTTAKTIPVAVSSQPLSSCLLGYWGLTYIRAKQKRDFLVRPSDPWPLTPQLRS